MYMIGGRQFIRRRPRMSIFVLLKTRLSAKIPRTIALKTTTHTGFRRCNCLKGVVSRMKNLKTAITNDPTKPIWCAHCSIRIAPSERHATKAGKSYHPRCIAKKDK
jgi:hypothetical protein